MVEKPIVSNREDDAWLRKQPESFRSRLQVNYNFRHSDLYQLISNFIASEQCGSVIQANVQMSQGFAFKSGSSDSWRCRLENSLGVLELVGVHFINMWLGLLGKPESTSVELEWNAGNRSNRSSPDTAFINMRFPSGERVYLCHSYAAPLTNMIQILGTNGTLNYDGNTLLICSPRDTFNNDGFYITPPIIASKIIPYMQMWRSSLERSIDCFLELVLKGKQASPQDLEEAMDTMYPVYDAREKLP